MILVGERILFCVEIVLKVVMNFKWGLFLVLKLYVLIVGVYVVILVIKMILFCSYGFLYYGVILLGGIWVGYFVGYGKVDNM